MPGGAAVTVGAIPPVPGLPLAGVTGGAAGGGELHPTSKVNRRPTTEADIRFRFTTLSFLQYVGASLCQRWPGTPNSRSYAAKDPIHMDGSFTRVCRTWGVRETSTASPECRECFHRPSHPGDLRRSACRA